MRCRVDHAARSMDSKASGRGCITVGARVRCTEHLTRYWTRHSARARATARATARAIA